MASRNYKYTLLLVVVGMASLATVASTKVAGPESIYCIAAPDPAFCETLVRGGKTAVQATARAITIGIAVAKQMQPRIHQFVESLPKDVPPALKNTAVDTCNKDSQEILHNYLSALDYLYSGDFNQLDIKMSALPMEKCLRCLEKIAVDPAAVKKAQDELNKYAEYIKLIARQIKK